MLIKLEQLPITKPVRGIIHIGAHECEERVKYHRRFRIGDDKIIWIDALLEKVDLMKKRIPNVKIYHKCISDMDNQTVSYMVTNHMGSSSILNFKTHAIEHPHVVEVGRIPLQTTTLQTFYKEANLNPKDYNFMNIDIQGAELLAFKGAGDILNDIDYIYSEVNERELYENCALMPQLDEYLAKYNFSRVMTKMTQHGWGDAFYVKK